MQLSSLQFPKCCFFILVLLFASNISESKSSFANDCDFNLPSARDGMFSPDGKKILFTSSRNGNNDIFIMNADGSDQKRVSKSELTDRVAHWSPDGKQIIFYSRKAGVSSKESWESAEIEVVNMDGTGRKKLTDDKYADQGPVFSPDGKKILFTSCRSGNREVYIMNRDGSGIKRLTDSLKKTEESAKILKPFDNNNPSWSVDGSRIYFYSKRDGTNGLYSVRISNSPDVKKLTNSEYNHTYPVPSPDGTKIAFSSKRENDADIYVMNADLTNEVRLTDAPGNENSPKWSRDGRRIVYESSWDGKKEIYVMNSDGSGQKRLTDNDKTDISPSWSVDGKKIIFASNRNGKYQIFTMNSSDGSEQKQLITEEDHATGASWSPDGKKIVFVLGAEFSNIYVMDADGKNKTPLTNFKAVAMAPVWSPNGSKIAFMSNKNGKMDIFVMDADGKNLKALTFGSKGER